MFSGIIAAIGKITSVEKRPKSLRLTIDAGKLSLNDLGKGDSIAVNGVCLTITSLSRNNFQVDVSQETLACTTGLSAVGEVNLEKALRLSDRLNGHLVLGHIDEVGVVQSFEPIGNNYALNVRYPNKLKPYIAKKGSIAINGVSLTINQIKGNQFTVNLIPHTLAVTTLKNLKKASKVNLEIDMMARYIENCLTSRKT